jgi:peroxiredoxin Q/BCP
VAARQAQLDNVVPDLKVAATGGQSFKLSDLRGHKVVLYFYPRDNTPGCTTEGLDFAAQHAKFRRRDAVVLGVSRDSLASHEKFREKFKFPFDLISDEDEKLCRAFDVIKQKNMYGKKVLGIERSTFIIDANGVLRKEFRKVKVAGHVEEVLEALKHV